LRRNWAKEKYRPANQASLLTGKTFGMTAQLRDLRGHRETLMAELSQIVHFLECSYCQVELQMDIERYWGRHCPFYLDLNNEDDIEDSAPKARDYKFGSYWSGPSDDTIRFIIDRLKWAKGIIEEEAVALIFEIKVLQTQTCW
jgi:hypothetical protein